MKDIISLIEEKLINSELFIFENYDSSLPAYINLDTVLTDAIGFCCANRLKVRPRDTGYAVMICREGEDVWCHLPVDVISDIAYAVEHNKHCVSSYGE